MHYELLFISLKNGEKPFKKWLGKLNDQDRVRILTRIRRFIKGNFGDFKSVGDGVFEARFFFGPGYRVYYAIEGKKIVLLINGGDKSSQNRDIKKAKELLKLWRLEDG